jgi:hypothetical protein
MKANAKSHTHCQVAQSHPPEPKLVNKYVFCQRTERNKTYSKFERK